MGQPLKYVDNEFIGDNRDEDEGVFARNSALEEDLPPVAIFLGNLPIYASAFLV